MTILRERKVWKRASSAVPREFEKPWKLDDHECENVLAALHELGGDLEDAGVKRLEEMMRLEEGGDAIERLVIDQDGAEQRLFRLNVVRRLTERYGRLFGERIEARRRGGLLSHGRNVSRFPPAAIPGRGGRSGHARFAQAGLRLVDADAYNFSRIVRDLAHRTEKSTPVFG